MWIVLLKGIIVHILKIICDRNGQKLVDKTVANIQKLVDNHELQEGQYNFLTYLLGREELSFRDVIAITLSLFNDGLTTVSSLAGCLTRVHLFCVEQPRINGELATVPTH